MLVDLRLWHDPDTCAKRASHVSLRPLYRSENYRDAQHDSLAPPQNVAAWLTESHLKGRPPKDPHDADDENEQDEEDDDEDEDNEPAVIREPDYRIPSSHPMGR